MSILQENLDMLWSAICNRTAIGIRTSRETYIAVPQGAQMEDGSGKNWNVYLQGYGWIFVRLDKMFTLFYADWKTSGTIDWSCLPKPESRIEWGSIHEDLDSDY